MQGAVGEIWVVKREQKRAEQETSPHSLLSLHMFLHLRVEKQVFISRNWDEENIDIPWTYRRRDALIGQECPGTILKNLNDLIQRQAWSTRNRYYQSAPITDRSVWWSIFMCVCSLPSWNIIWSKFHQCTTCSDDVEQTFQCCYFLRNDGAFSLPFGRSLCLPATKTTLYDPHNEGRSTAHHEPCLHSSPAETSLPPMSSMVAMSYSLSLGSSSGHQTRIWGFQSNSVGGSRHRRTGHTVLLG